MSEEKKLPDEAVEDVTGGFDVDRDGEAYGKFNANNCAICEAYGSCSFKNTFKAFEQLGGQDCPDFRGYRRKSP